MTDPQKQELTKNGGYFKPLRFAVVCYTTDGRLGRCPVQYANVEAPKDSSMGKRAHGRKTGTDWVTLPVTGREECRTHTGHQQRRQSGLEILTRMSLFPE